MNCACAGYCVRTLGALYCTLCGRNVTEDRSMTKTTKPTKPKSPNPKPLRRAWSWDENVLVIDAWHRIQQNPADLHARMVMAKLAEDLKTTPRAVRNAIQAVGRSRNNSDALAILMHRHNCREGLTNAHVAAAEAKKVRKRLGLLP